MAQMRGKTVCGSARAHLMSNACWSVWLFRYDSFWLVIAFSSFAAAVLRGGGSVDVSGAQRTVRGQTLHATHRPPCDFELAFRSRAAAASVFFSASTCVHSRAQRWAATKYENLRAASHLRTRGAVPAASAGQLCLLNSKAGVVALGHRCRPLKLLQLPTRARVRTQSSRQRARAQRARRTCQRTLSHSPTCRQQLRAA